MARPPWWRHLLPGRCTLCDIALPPSAPLDLCDHCHAALPWNRRACPRCALPAPMGASPWCLDCERRPPPFAVTVAPLRYESFAAAWVRQLKERMGVVEGHLLGALLARAATACYAGGDVGRPDLLVPVPLTWRRLVRRGHNQSLSLAAPVAQALGVPLWRLGVTRRGPSDGQRGQSRVRRLGLTAGTFHVRPRLARRLAAADLRVGIVDDVMTTGATAAALASTLLEAGAAEVHVLAATRTPPPALGAAPTARPGSLGK